MKQEVNMPNKTKNLILIILFLFNNYIYAYDDDKNEPIFLESDSAKWDEESRKSTYRGNVIVTQGTMLLTGDLLIVTSENN